MRKILLLTVVIFGYHLPTFSQINSQLQIDSIVVKFGFNNSPKTLVHADSIDFRQLLNRPEKNKYMLDPKLSNKDVHFGQLSNARLKALHPIDNMPCMYPQGSFPMPVFKPDSTVNYTLLIKKF